MTLWNIGEGRDCRSHRVMPNGVLTLCGLSADDMSADSPDVEVAKCLRCDVRETAIERFRH